MQYEQDFFIEPFRSRKGPRSDKGQRHRYPARRVALRQRKDKGKRHRYPASRKKAV